MPASMVIELFGPMRVLINDQPLPRVRSRKAYWLLALLVLREGRPASREWLASALWPDVDLSTAYANLRPVISELRRALGSEGDRLVSESRNLLGFRLDGVSVDLFDFAAAIRSKDFDRAMELYRSPLLEGCSEEWAIQERQLREHECLSALQTSAEDALESGDFTKATEACYRAIALDPFRDVTRRTLMESLVRSGDVQGALQVYREFTHLLSRELRMAPEAATSELYNKLRTELKEPHKKPTPCQSPLHNLPAPLSPLIGRDDEQIDVLSLVRKHRLVTLTGIGGIGKTRLASAVAHEVLTEFPDGVWFVALDPLTDEASVPSAVAAAVGQNSFGALIEHWRARKAFLVLDNCEHLVPAATRVIDELLRQCPLVRVLATSREVLDIAAEKVWPVPTLAYPDISSLPAGRATRLRVVSTYESVRLFVERAQAVQHRFELDDDNLADVVDICNHVEGIPLAIELAAARMRSMAPKDIAPRLREHHLDVLGRRTGRGDDRQRSLRATLDWSYALLSQDEKSVLERLSVFAGGWTLEAAEQVVTDDSVPTGTLSGILDMLVDRSLVVFDLQGKRYRFLETVRQFAAEKLDETTAKRVRSRHCKWCVDWSQKLESKISVLLPREWDESLRIEMPNIRIALASCDQDPKAGLLITGSLWRFFLPSGFLEEGYWHLRSALRLDKDKKPTIERAKVLLGATYLAFDIPSREAGMEFAKECLEIFRKADNTAAVAESLEYLAITAVHLNHIKQARQYFEEGIEVARKSGHLTLLADLLNEYAVFLEMQNEQQAERQVLEECLSIRRAMGKKLQMAVPLRSLAVLELTIGNFEKAQIYADEALSLVVDTQDRVGLGNCLEICGYLAAELLEIDRAESIFQEALELYRSLNDWLGVSKILGHLAQLRYYQGRWDAAADLAEEVVTRCRERGETRGMARAADVQIAVLLVRDREVDARALCMDRLIKFQEAEFTRGTVLMVERLAQCALHRGESTTAGRLLGLVDAISQEFSLIRPLRREREFADIASRVRAALSEDEFAAAHKDGGLMKLEDLARPVVT